MTRDENMMWGEICQLESRLSPWELEFICSVDSSTVLSDWQSKKLHEIWAEKVNGGHDLLPEQDLEPPPYMK